MFIALILCVFFSRNVLSFISLQNIVDKMIADLQQNRLQLVKNPKLISQFVDRKLIPYIDMDRVVISIVGRRYWQMATAVQRKLFIWELKKLVVAIYSTILTSYDKNHIRFQPIRISSKMDNQKEVTVEGVIICQNGQQVPIRYSLINEKGQWKICNFNIKGIVQNYRSQFSGIFVQAGRLTTLLKYFVGG
nr:ABC transporter substrate-binding protein [Coxiella endosymbiont of Amblyomma sculptum]